MKKIFTSISLAAMTFMATTPMMAASASSVNTANEGVATLLSEIKTVSGIDMAALLSGNANEALTMPTIAIHPDSARINLTGLLPKNESEKALPIDLANIKTVFSDYQKLKINASGVPVEIEVPGKIYIDILAGQGFTFNISVAAAESNAATLPIKNLAIDMEIPSALESILPALGINLKSGNLLKMEENVANGVSTVAIKAGETGLVIAKMLGIENVAPLTETITNLTKLSTDKLASIEKWATDATGNRLVQQKDSLFGVDIINAAMVPDSIISEKYDNGKVVSTTTTHDFRKVVMTGTEGNYVDKTAIVTTKAEAANSSVMSHTKTSMNYPIDDTNITLSAISNILKDLTLKKSGEVFVQETFTTNATDASKDKKELSKVTVSTEFLKCENNNTIDSLHATISVETPAPQAAVPASEAAVALVKTMKFDVAMVKDQVSVDFLTGGNKMATIYFTTNLNGIITNNETITPELDATVTVAQNGLYINNCENATYSIVSMNGKMIANGIISGDGAFVATPSLQIGQIYIVTIVENGAKKSIKFVKR